MSLILNKTSEKYFQYVGLVFSSYVILKLLYKIISNLYVFTFGGVNLKKYGSWAVITGCTDGIGLAYTEYVAKKGLNIVLISRSEAKLKDLSDSLKSKYTIETKIIVANFAEENGIYDEIRKQLVGLDIGILVNNVGVGNSYPEYFHLIPDIDSFTNNMVHCNIISVTKMTAIVLGGMVEKKRGIIVNLASAAGRKPLHLNNVYSATKAYCDFFSRSLALDYQSKGIIVQSVCPYFVATNMSKMRRSLLVLSPKDYVANAMKTIGSQVVTNGCIIHNIQGWVIESLLPEWLLNHLTAKQLHGTRARALKKLKNNQNKKE